MKPSRLLQLTALVLLSASPLVAEEDVARLEVAFSDAGWDGVKVPTGQQCQKFGGNGQSPSLVVKAIPAKANALLIDFSDRSYRPMDDGGHGQIGYSIDAGSIEVTVPSVAGHTMELPPGFFVVAAHKAPTWDKAGAYLPPCSGGRGNSYYLTVKAVHKAEDEVEVLAKASLEMGKF